MPHKIDRTINNLYAFIYGDLPQNPTPVRLRADGLIETDDGWFLPVYSRDTNSVALFFARHPDHLRADKVMASGCLELADKKRFYVAQIYKVLHDEWRVGEGDAVRNRFHLKYLPNDIEKIVGDIGRVFFHQANLHQMVADSSASAHVNYHAPLVNGSSPTHVKVTTRSHSDHLLADAPERVFLAERFKDAGHLIARRHPPLRIDLSIVLAEQGGKTREFDHEGLGPVIGADYSQRLRRIQSGQDSIHRRERPLLVFYRAKESLWDSLAEMREAVRDDTEMFVREAGEKVGSFALGGFIDPLKDIALHYLTHAGVREPSKVATKEARGDWKRFVMHEGPVVKSDIYDLMPRPNLKYFGDWGGFNPEKHDVQIGLEPIAVDHERTFRIWLRQQFKPPFDSTIRYLGEHGRLVDPRPLELSDYHKNIKIVRFKVGNGVHVYFDPTRKIMYAYYHETQYLGDESLRLKNDRDQQIPLDCAARFQAGRVWVRDLVAVNAPLQNISFHEFKDEMKKATGSDSWSMPSADKVPAYAIERDEPVPVAPPPVAKRAFRERLRTMGIAV